MNYFIVIFLCSSLINDSFQKIARIIGGEITDIKEFPFMASFRMPKGNYHFCGGAIISEQHVLTAAHCLYSRQEYFMVIKIYLGTSSSWSLSVPYHEISRVTMHPMYTSMTPTDGNFNDIAVVKVRKRINFNEFQQKGIISTEDVKDGDVATIIGWGLTRYPSTFLEEELRKLRIILIDNNNCQPLIKVPINDNHLCGLAGIESGGCIGDSGGPLVSNGKIIGIYSFSIPCATGAPEVFTRIYSFLDFINDVIKK